MFEIQCDNCGDDVIVDEISTSDAYLKDGGYTVFDNGKIVEASINQYLIYTCLLCDKNYKLTYKEWEARYRKVVAQQVMEIRKEEMFAANIDPRSINPDNGLEYCGQCSGYEGDGHCFVDVIKQCTIRKEK